MDRIIAFSFLQSTVSKFLKTFQSHGYIIRDSEKISSGYDPTVRFIGSHISVLKPLLLEGRIPNMGVIMAQPCIRTRAVAVLRNDFVIPEWGSHFISLGGLVPQGQTKKLSFHAIDWLIKIQEIPSSDVIIRVASIDRDLVDVCEMIRDTYDINIEKDGFSLDYYRHGVGAQEVLGRNFNIAIKNKSGIIKDVGNIILYSRNGCEIGVELAFGSTVILLQQYELDHIYDSYPLCGFPEKPRTLARKLEDTVVVCITLFREGLKPRGSNNRHRILKKYVEGIQYLIEALNYQLNDLKTCMEKYELTMYGDSFATNEIITYLMQSKNINQIRNHHS